MAIDAHHLLLSTPQLFSNNNNTTMEPTNSGFFTNNQTGYTISPFSNDMYGYTTTTNSFPFYTDGTDLEFGFSPSPLTTKKRSRDSTFSFLGQDIDISSHIIQQQNEVDRFVSRHMERVRFEIEEKRNKQVRMIIESIEHRLTKRLRVKEEERERIGKINNALEERVKSLSVENQIWRDLAQSNEATANNLRNNLEQILAFRNVNGGDDDDAQSCCGSSSGEEAVRMCRNCGKEESCVLLLPCRHLCLCGVCGSSVHTCPICRSPKNASVHVNMSS